MGHNWILDVLADLKAFAQQNELPILAEQLADASLVAAAEISSQDEGTPEGVRGHDAQAGDVYRRTGTSDIA